MSFGVAGSRRTLSTIDVAISRETGRDRSRFRDSWSSKSRSFTSCRSIRWVTPGSTRCPTDASTRFPTGSMRHDPGGPVSGTDVAGLRSAVSWASLALMDQWDQAGGDIELNPWNSINSADRRRPACQKWNVRRVAVAVLWLGSRAPGNTSFHVKHCRTRRISGYRISRSERLCRQCFT